MAGKKVRGLEHPGVVILKRVLPSGALRWQFRFTDPETGKQLKPMFEGETRATEKGTPRVVKQWAIAKSKELAEQRVHLEYQRRRQAEREREGLPAPAKSVPLTEMLDAFERRKRALQKRERTIETHKATLVPFLAWLAERGVTHTGQLTEDRLREWHDHVCVLPRHAAAVGGRRGEREASERTRAPTTINRSIVAVKGLLGFMRGVKTTRINSDELREALPAVPVPRGQPEFLEPGQLQKVIEAAMRHDAATFKITRQEHDAGTRHHGNTARYEPIAPLLAFLLLSGCRRGEALGEAKRAGKDEVLALRWRDVNLDALDADGKRVGQFNVHESIAKTRMARIVRLEVSPALLALLAALKLQAGDDCSEKRVFEGLTVGIAEAARKRLIKEYGAPAFSWQLLRSTCATYLTNAPGIFGGASAYHSARQLGHEPTIAAKHYTGVISLPREARTLEAAMQIEAQVRRVVAALQPAAGAQLAPVVQLAPVRS